MCGIAGLILDELDPRGPDWLTRMTQLLVHRGPDDGGAVAFGLQAAPTVERTLGPADEAVSWGHLPMKIGLGARRLAVIDLSPAGRQPMKDPEGRIWLVFNGEIYNHAALREELRARGLVFVGQSDTEVLLAAYRAWGCGCFERLEGMWALAIVDWAARKVVLSRDRFGIKPLYLTRFDAGIAFASEIKSLLILPGARRGANEARLRDFLSEGLADHTDDTLFEGVWSAPAGCWIEIDMSVRASLKRAGAVHRYWRPGFAWRDQPDAPGIVRAALQEAVRAHLRSDVPVGSCLSGGIDSSAVVTLIHKLAAADPACADQWTQHTFTASLPGCELDETRYAERVVQSCPGLSWRRVEPTAAKLGEDLASLMWHQEQPFGSPSIYLQWEVMRLAGATGVTVLLDGQGGDELFCGYEGYLPPYIAHLLARGRLFRLIQEYRCAAGLHLRPGGLIAHAAAHLLPQDLRGRLRRQINARRQSWLVPGLFAADEKPDWYEALRLRPPESIEGSWRDAGFSRHLWRILLRESLPALLRFEDRNSMAFSIEARVPMLDRRLVELALSLPPREKIEGGVLKSVLRRAMRGLVPEEILDRRDKIGFTAPTDDWMRGGLREWWQDLVGSQSFRERGCFSGKGVAALVKRFEAGDAAAALHVWRLAIVEQWARQFLDAHP